MSELEKASDGGLGLAFLLTEMRDLRKGMESRDERIHGSLDGLRGDVTILSTKVDHSQGDVAKIKGDVKGLRDDVDSIMDDRKADALRRESAWSGPKKVGTTLVAIGGALGAVLVIMNFWPAAAAFLPF